MYKCVETGAGRDILLQLVINLINYKTPDLLIAKIVFKLPSTCGRMGRGEDNLKRRFCTLTQLKYMPHWKVS